MRKFTLLVGVGIGFVVGSKAGNGPYKKLASKARKVGKRPEVQDAVEQLTSSAGYKAADLVDKLPSGPAEVHEAESESDTVITLPVPEPIVTGGPLTEGP